MKHKMFYKQQNKISILSRKNFFKLTIRYHPIDKILNCLGKIKKIEQSYPTTKKSSLLKKKLLKSFIDITKIKFALEHFFEFNISIV